MCLVCVSFVLAGLAEGRRKEGKGGEGRGEEGKGGEEKGRGK